MISRSRRSTGAASSSGRGRSPSPTPVPAAAPRLPRLGSGGDGDGDEDISTSPRPSHLMPALLISSRGGGGGALGFQHGVSACCSAASTTARGKNASGLYGKLHSHELIKASTYTLMMGQRFEFLLGHGKGRMSRVRVRLRVPERPSKNVSFSYSLQT
ncbi:Os07g0201402 [Oryza sativa Japonica Group]|uniref:Os07g0201402 protein n=1 Tax=Oryza sativa subsp. japonica TaxID=39947 RepID=A0A0P0X3G8_ORYSJ|nr:Os07g0201402 [Oryza sativa Japonica Group]